MSLLELKKMAEKLQRENNYNNNESEEERTECNCDCDSCQDNNCNKCFCCDHCDICTECITDGGKIELVDLDDIKDVKKLEQKIIDEIYEDINTINYNINIQENELVMCNKCKVCFTKDIKHICDNMIVQKITDNCPICLDKLDSDVEANKPLLLICGHIVHCNCREFLFKHSYKCPICMKTVIDMSEQFCKMDHEIDENPMPKELVEKVDIKCNDCKTTTLGAKFHFVGLKCKKCKSYNTYTI
jgi:hypothetical protein